MYKRTNESCTTKGGNFQPNVQLALWLGIELEGIHTHTALRWDGMGWAALVTQCILTEAFTHKLKTLLVFLPEC